MRNMEKAINDYQAKFGGWDTAKGRPTQRKDR